MRRMSVAAVSVSLLLAVAVVGCKAKEEAKPQPKVSPPAIATAGVLKAGVDLSTPPFAGTDQKQRAGIDVDVAAALADKLGLEVTYVDVAPSEAATALASGQVDVVLSVPVTDADLTRLTPAGTYLVDAPAAFIAVEGTASVEPSMTLATLPTSKVAAQKESPAFWATTAEYGDEAVEPFDTLREAFIAVDQGQYPAVVGSALVGAYLGRDVPRVKYAGQLAPGTPLAVAVAVDNAALGDVVRTTLDALAADGVLDSVRRKWVGDLPELKAAAVESTTTP